MSGLNGNGRIWWKILAGLAPLAVIGFVALVTLRADVQHLETAVTAKASRDVVEAQQAAILRELQLINDRLDRIERRP